MPVPAIKAAAKHSSITTARAEHLWQRAKEHAKAQGMEGRWGYVMNIFKSSMGKKRMRPLHKKREWTKPEQWDTLKGGGSVKGDTSKKESLVDEAVTAALLGVPVTDLIGVLLDNGPEALPTDEGLSTGGSLSGTNGE